MMWRSLVGVVGAGVTALACGDVGGGADGGPASGSSETGGPSGVGASDDMTSAVDTEATDSEGPATGGTSPQTDVMSDDGLFVLHLPAGALPPGVSPDEVSVTAVDPMQGIESIEGTMPFQAYGLEPDGTELLVPATFEITIDAPDPPFAMLVAHDSTAFGREFPTVERVDEDSDALQLAGELEHFSTVRAETVRDFEAEEAIAVHNTAVRHRTVAAWRTRFPFGEAGMHTVTFESDLVSRATWTAKSTWLGIGAIGVIGPLSPTVTHQPGTPGSPASLSTSPMVSVGSFRCDEPGQIGSRFAATLLVEGVRNEFSGDGETILDSTTTARFFLLREGSSAQCSAPATDASGDHGDSEGGPGSIEDPGQLDAIDLITGVAANLPAASEAPRDPGWDSDRDGPVALTPAEIDAMFGDDGAYACDADNEAFTVVCPAASLPMPQDADVYFYSMQMAGPLLTDDAARRYQYAVVVDSDGQAGNDWVPQGPFVNDFFQGADRWFVAEWNAAGWSLTATQVDAAQTTTVEPTTARVVVFDDHLQIFVSANEFPLAEPAWRFTAYGDDGAFSFDDRAGDVWGDFPPTLSSDYE